MANTQENVRINFVTAYDGKGLNNAKAQLNGFDKLANKAAKAFIGLFAVQKVTAFGKASLDAFTSDQKAAQALTKTLINLGLGFQSTGVEDFIQKLETTTGVLDDQLRPAFASLARATGSVAKSQTLLNLALDISAGTGKDLGSVSTALSKAYLGQTTALGRLGAGLTKSELASKDFAAIQDRLTQIFAGQAAQAADTYAGKIDKLKVAFDNMKESVGLGLVTAFETLSGPSGSISKTTEMIQNLGYAISGEIQGIAKAFAFFNGILNKLWDNPVGRFLQKFNITKAAINSLVDSGKQAAYTEKLKANTKALEQSYAQQKKNLVTSQTQLSVDKAALALKQASRVLDLNQIEIFAAMQTAQGDDLNRLKLQQAILDGNAVSATALANKVLQANGLVMDLQGNIKVDPFAQWINSLTAALDNLKKIQATVSAIQVPTGAAAAAAMPTYTPLSSDSISAIASNINYQSVGGNALINAIINQQATEVKVTVDPAAMAYGISLANQNQSSNGTQTTLSRNNPGYFIPQS